ncbi:MAG: hypothetical protein AAF587_28925 [Bacteroidota bacterium]
MIFSHTSMSAGSKIFLLLGLSIVLSLTVAHAQANWLSPITLEYGSSVLLSNFGDYNLKPKDGFGYYDHEPKNYQLGIFYQASPRWAIGLRSTSNNFEKGVRYINAQREGESVMGRWGEPALYQRSHRSSYSMDAYHSFVIRRSLLETYGLKVTASAGITAMQVNYRYLEFAYFEAERGKEWEVDADVEVKKWMPGIEAEIGLSYQLSPWLTLFANTSLIQGLYPASDLSTHRLRTAKFNYGIQLRQDAVRPIQSKRKNTIMVGTSYYTPVVSYERLLAQRKYHRHSLRIFGDAYFAESGTPGLAYNIKLGQKRHFFLAEAGVTLSGYPLNNVYAGYEYRGKKGLVFRLDGGSSWNSYEAYPTVQVHAGYAF